MEEIDDMVISNPAVWEEMISQALYGDGYGSHLSPYTPSFSEGKAAAAAPKAVPITDQEVLNLFKD